MRDTNVSVAGSDGWARAIRKKYIDFDGDSSNPHFSYMDEQNRLRYDDVWFLDAVTALNEMRAAQRLGIETFALWRLGAEDRSLWRVWDVPGDPAAPDKLKDVLPGQDVDMEGQGENSCASKIVRPTVRREITVDPDGIIRRREHRTSLPQPYRVAR